LPKVRLHPNLAGVYRDKVAALEQALADPSIKAEAAEVVSQPDRADHADATSCGLRFSETSPCA
jgi:hypothetical protein